MPGNIMPLWEMVSVTIYTTKCWSGTISSFGRQTKERGLTPFLVLIHLWQGEFEIILPATEEERRTIFPAAA